jgi:hypothetical protein
MPSHKYLKLLDYISYFEQKDFDFCTWQKPSETDDRVVEMGYPVYDEGIQRFIQEVYDSDLLMSNYSDYLDRNQIDLGKMIVNITVADFQLLRAILTHSVRGERFCDGFWGQRIKDKTFLKILCRLREIAE